MEFDKALSRGRRVLGWIGHAQRQLLSLEEFTSICRPELEINRGVRDIPVSRIIGTEDRSADYSIGYYPVHKWMKERWSKVRRLFLAGKISETIKVLEYGGHYFVRDGNHRVSVAACHGIEYLTADVILLQVPVVIDRTIGRDCLELFRAKVAIQRQNQLFDVLPEKRFEVRRSGTWQTIQDSIFIHHRAWLAKQGRYSDNAAELVRSWDGELYQPIMAFIRRSLLPSLFGGAGATDVFSYFMDFWRRTPDADFNSVWNACLRDYQWRHPWMTIVHALNIGWKRLGISACEEQAHFFELSHISEFRPDARIPPGPAEWYTFLIKQLFSSHDAWIRQKLGRSPFMDELVPDWYDRLFKRALDWYEQAAITIPFHRFYMEWMRMWGRRIRNEGIGLYESGELCRLRMLRREGIRAPL